MFYKSIPIHLNDRIYNISDKDTKEKDKLNQYLLLPRLSVCADVQKIDRTKLAQTEVGIDRFKNEIIEDDYSYIGKNEKLILYRVTRISYAYYPNPPFM